MKRLAALEIKHVLSSSISLSGIEERLLTSRSFGISRGPFLAVAVFSGFANILLLTSPLFMLQVYDRVLTSHSVPTLVALTVLAALLIAFFAVLDLVRQRVLTRIGMAVDASLSRRVFRTSLRRSLTADRTAQDGDPLRDLDTIRQFLSGPGPLVVFDLPWLPLYLVVVYLLHVWLGLIATVGAVLLIALTVLNELMVRKGVQSAADAASARRRIAATGHRNTEVVHALGMHGVVGDRWLKAHSGVVEAQRQATDAVGGFSSLIKGLRLFLQVLILAVGGYLAINQQVTAGVMIAASIIATRALAPVELAVSQWRNFVEVGHARKRLAALLSDQPAQRVKLDLPVPKRSLEVEGLTIVPPGTEAPVLNDVSFTLQAGQGLGVIGPVASGKSSLARALTGIWPHADGSIRLDAAELEQWDSVALGRHVGYLPQDVELFDGTIGENIARFDPEMTSERVIDAARLAGAHDLIVRMPDGYNLEVGEAGRRLSAGQRQRIGLARALYGMPFLIVLDEPNANLDAQGEDALVKAIHAARNKGSIVVVMAHRPSGLAATDMALVLVEGRQRAFGPRDEVLNQVLVPGTVRTGRPSKGGARDGTG